MLNHLLTDIVNSITPPPIYESGLKDNAFLIVGLIFISIVLCAGLIYAIIYFSKNKKDDQKINEQDLGTLTDEEKKIILEHRLKELNEKKDHSQHDKQH